MFALHKGDCEHCLRTFRYTLLHAGFGDFSYAYCDCCGMLATFNYSDSILVNLPPPYRTAPGNRLPTGSRFSIPAHAADIFAQELRRVACSATRALSAEHAAAHIERNSVGAAADGTGKETGPTCIAWRWKTQKIPETCVRSPIHSSNAMRTRRNPRRASGPVSLASADEDWRRQRHPRLAAP